MSVSLKKPLPKRTERWITAAEMIAGPGTGWPSRFVAIVAAAAKEGTVKTISLTHVQNVAGDHRNVTDDLERLIVALAPAAIKKMEETATALTAATAVIEAELKEKQK